MYTLRKTKLVFIFFLFRLLSSMYINGFDKMQFTCKNDYIEGVSLYPMNVSEGN